ncbi:MAG TPA: DUF4252 domain-containing protein [Thermoanaerobaculia bacterium]
MRKLILLTIVLALAAMPASAQRLNIDIPGLADRATEVVDVTLDAQMLRLASSFFSGDADERAIRDIVHALEGIYVRAYEFDKPGEYDMRQVENFRRQLGPTWKRIVNVRSRDRDNVEVYTDVRGEKVVGLVVIAAEPRELTIVNIVGPIDMARLADLEGHFGVPNIKIEVKDK